MNEIDVINNEIHRLMKTYPGYSFELKMKKITGDEEYHQLVLNDHGEPDFFRSV